MTPPEQMVLVVDDDEPARKLLTRQLTAIGYETMGVDNGESALEALAAGRFAAALVDLHLPGMGGHKTLAGLLERDPEIAVLMVTGAGDVDDAMRAMHAGAFDHLGKPISLEQLRLAVGRALELRQLRHSRQEQERRMQARLDEQELRLNRSCLDTVMALAGALEARDQYTCGHGERVTRYAVQLAWEAGLRSDAIEQIAIAGPLHDIGKIGVHEEVLNKPGTLSEEEYEHIKKHPITGVQLLERATSLESALPIVRHHHERYDGTGHPDGLAGEDIPLPARVVALADAFDAMTSSRAYRKALPVDEARRRLIEGSGSQWDSRLVEIFVSLLDRGELIDHEDRAEATVAAEAEAERTPDCPPGRAE